MRRRRRRTSDASGRAESECGSGRKGGGTSSDDGGTSSMSARSAGKVDGNATETEAERLERLRRNRESAKNMRARKREYVRDLERRASALEKQNGALQGMVMHLTNENHALRMNLQAATGVAIADRDGAGAVPDDDAQVAVTAVRRSSR